MTHATRALQSHDLSGEGIKLWITYILFWPHKDMRASPDEWSAQCRGQLRDSTNMKCHPNKANMEWWWRRPNYIRGPWGPKASRRLSYRWGKTPRKPHPGNLSRPGIETGPAAWQARMIPLAPQRWTEFEVKLLKYFLSFSLFTLLKVRRTPPGLKTQMLESYIPVGGATDYGTEHQTDTPLM